MGTGDTQSVPVQIMAASHGADIGPPAQTIRKERRLRKALIFFGVLVLGYIYSDSLSAQQSAARRVSIGQAVDFPNDI